MTSYKKNFDNVIAHINKFNNDWITNYWSYHLDEGSYEWKIYNNYKINLSIKELINSVCKHNNIYMRYSDWVKIIENSEDNNDNIFEKERFINVANNISILTEINYKL